MNKPLEGTTIFSFIIFGMLGIRLISLPHDLAMYAKNNSWLSIVLLSILAFFNIYSYLWVYSKNPGLNYSQIVEKSFGKFLGKISMLLFSLAATSAIGLSLRLFTESLNLYLLEKTPALVIMMVMILTCLYALKLDVYSIGIVLELLMPVSLFFIFLMFLLSLSSADFKNLQPVFTGGFPPIIKAAFHAGDPIEGTLICAYILPYFRDFKTVKTWALFGAGVSMLVYLIVVVVCIAVLSGSELQYLIFPVIIVAKSIQLKTPLFERAESLFMASWIPITFGTILLIYLISTLNLKVLFNTKKNNLIMYLQMPIFILIARFPKNIAQLLEFFSLLSKLILCLNLIYVPIILIITLIKERRNSGEI